MPASCCFRRLIRCPATGAIAVLSGGTLAVAAGGPGEFTNATSGANSIGGLLSGVGRNGVPVGFASGAAIGIDTTDAIGGLTYSGLIANPNGGANVLGLLKLGSGALTLTAANNYTGGTTINGGTIALSGAGRLGSGTGALTFNGGSLNLGGINQRSGW